MKKIIILALILLAPQFASATNYFVKTGGNDSYTGLSDAQAWATLSKVMATVSVSGDDVYFKCGDTWTGSRLAIYWDGVSAANPSIIGAYYMDGSEVTDYATVKAQIDSEAQARPIIQGNTTAASDIANWTQPSDNWSGLIWISNRSFVRVENMETYKSAGYGIASATSTCGTDEEGIEIYNCTAIESGRAGIFHNRNIHDSTVSYSTATGAGLRYHYGLDSDWPVGIGYSGNHCGTADNNTISHSTVYNCWTEGIGFYKHSNYGTAEYNTIYNCRFGVYVANSTYATVRYNLIYGTVDSGSYGTRNMGTGIGVADEYDKAVSPFETGVKVYGNFIAYAGYGIAFWEGATGGSLTDMDVFNNTIVDALRGIRISVQSGRTTSDFIIENNLVRSDISGDTLAAYDGGGSFSGITWDYNLWDSDPGANFRGTHDPGYSLYSSQNVAIQKITGWDSILGGSLTRDDFILNVYNDGIDAGVDFGNDPVNLDYWSTNRDTYTPWDIGADEYANDSETVIAPAIPPADPVTPSGTYPPGTTSMPMPLLTNINATLKFDTTDTTYALMSNTYSSTGGTSHTHTVTGLTNGNTYTYYIRAADSTSSYVVTFSIDPGQTNLLSASTYVAGSDTNTYEECHQLSNIWNGSIENGYMYCDATMGCAGCTTAVQEYDFKVSYDITDVNTFGDNLNNWTCSTWAFKWKLNAVDEWTTAFTGASCNAAAWDSHEVTITARYARLEYFATTSLEVREAVVYGTPTAAAPITPTANGIQMSGMTP